MCIISYSLKGMYKLLFFIAYFTLISFPSSGEITQKIKDLNSAAPFTDVKNLTSDLKLINNAMNSTIHIEGRFVQYAPDGSIIAGNLFISRPGKLRIEYDSPNLLLIVSDGVSLIQKDVNLGTTDRVPLSSTPIYYFLKRNINLDKDVVVTSLIKNEEEWYISITDPSDEAIGVLNIILDADKLSIKGWTIINGSENTTYVKLTDITYPEILNPRLFLTRERSRRKKKNN